MSQSIRHRLLALTLVPLLGVLPLLGLILLLWGNTAIDGLLISKIRSDLAVAQGYFDRVLAEVGSGTQAVAESYRLQRALAIPTPERAAALDGLLSQVRHERGLDFLQLLPPDTAGVADNSTSVAVLPAAELDALAPGLSEQSRIALVATDGAAPTDRTAEDRGLVLVAHARVTGAAGQTVGWLRGGVLLNRNLGFIDHINEIVYPAGSLAFGSQGTATLFLDDVRVSTNVRLFGDPAAERAIGTRVSAVVREAVLGRGDTWLGRAFVVKDWYVSGYLPLADAGGRRVGMLYVGFLERPFVAVKYAVLAGIGLVFFAVMLLAAWWSLRAAGRIFRPLERMTETMRRVESGEATARVGPVTPPDEIGRLATTLDHLLDTVDDKTRALQHWGDALDHKVAERTAALEAAQQQLVRSEKLAAIGQLTASIAHEINNPIAVIQGNLDLMRLTLGAHATPVRDEIRLIDAQVERMRLIVTQLLQYARPNEYAGYVERLDAAEVVQDSLVLVRHLLERERVRLDNRCVAGSAPRVAINRQELQQVLINLMVNAVQAMAGGSGGSGVSDRERVLTLAMREAADGAVCIDVADTGPGLDEATRAALFQPFFTTKRDGNGLGLWISRGLLERYGGALRAANRPADNPTTAGPGAVFTICLLADVRSTPP
ncbi:cache domain-containing protein [uncultured Sphaerotilus sp.]|uniref:sensor histidine kinase n=1 Tax=uncultured Sphaerotilus sp. TaxID=474984 RepID=UPI0030CA3100